MIPEEGDQVVFSVHGIRRGGTLTVTHVDRTLEESKGQVWVQAQSENGNLRWYRPDVLTPDKGDRDG